MVVLRDAAPGDAAGIAAVHVRAWREGYIGLMPDEYLTELDEGERALIWEERLLKLAAGPEDVDQDDLVMKTDTFVAVAAEQIVGIATVGPHRADPHDAATGELWMLNVRPDAWSRGVGSALLGEALQRLRARRCSTGVLWVVEANARARQLYERHGWLALPLSRPLVVAGQEVPEVCYRIALT